MQHGLQPKDGTAEPTSESATDTPAEREYAWTDFYADLADALLAHRGRRADLAHWYGELCREHGLGEHLDTYVDGSTGPVRDMCPFTLLGLFNTGTVPAPARTRIAADLAARLGVDTPAPTRFDGVPAGYSPSPWTFGTETERGDQIDYLWQTFADALALAAEPHDAQLRERFAASLTIAVRDANWQVVTGLYHARPLVFPPLDPATRALIRRELGIGVPMHHRTDVADVYLDLCDSLHAGFREPDAVARSLPEFVLAAWQLARLGPDAWRSRRGRRDPGEYDAADLRADGCFLALDEIERILGRLRTKKNLVLQGAPGTGKTWLARRLAWALGGRRDTDAVRVVQFHPNTSYEDFIRGWRPHADADGTGRLTLTDGPFLQLADQAREQPDVPHVMVIEEINRGNPAQAFGEMLTLLENTKRNPADGITLAYPRPEETNGVHLPENLFVIGTMNIADRSLALVDLALRRRFAFVTLEPQFNDAWASWVRGLIADQGTDARAFVAAIRAAIRRLNAEISGDRALGPDLVIGHSYLTPTEPVTDARGWYRDVVETEIVPLLDEYWFDDPERALVAGAALLAAW